MQALLDLSDNEMQEMLLDFCVREQQAGLVLDAHSYTFSAIKSSGDAKTDLSTYLKKQGPFLELQNETPFIG